MKQPCGVTTSRLNDFSPYIWGRGPYTTGINIILSYALFYSKSVYTSLAVLPLILTDSDEFSELSLFAYPQDG